MGELFYLYIMLNDFYILHRHKPNLIAHGQFPLWSTCLRSLAFSKNLRAAPGDEIFTQTAAYRFLLQVICGLQSPILGETEVFGQFKKFSQEWLALEPQRAPLVQRLLSDAKAVRTQYLRDLGTQSYGSWVRTHLRPERVHFLGAGQLAREIYPYLEKQQREIVLHARTAQTVISDSFPVPVRAVAERAFDHGALIVAAPLTAHEIAHWLGNAQPAQIIDLRDCSSEDRLAYPGVVVLKDIFSHIEKTRRALQPRVEKAQLEIAQRSERAAARPLVRPQGWDDLCA